MALNEIEVTTPVTLTPEMLARSFWAMSSVEQAEFFAELNKVIQHDHATDPKSWAWSLGEMQWLYLGDELDKNQPAREMLMTIAAPMYMHTLRATA